MSKAPLKIQIHWPTRMLRGSLQKFWKDTSGVSATEFALLAPVFLIILAGVIDIGFTLYAKFRMEGQVSAVANYAMTDNIPVPSSETKDFEEYLERLVDISRLSGTNNNIQRLNKIHVNLNNTYTGTWENETFSVQAQAGDLSDCYCPTRQGSTIIWGSIQNCSSLCSDGSRAGKYLWFETENSSPLSLFRRFGFAPELLKSNVLVRLAGR